MARPGSPAARHARSGIGSRRGRDGQAGDVDVFAANDSMAVGLLSGLRTAGVDVPGEMAIVGFDDTTIAQMASAACDASASVTYQI